MVGGEGSHWRAITAKREEQIECETFPRAYDIYSWFSMISVLERWILAEFPLLSVLVVSWFALVDFITKKRT